MRITSKTKEIEFRMVEAFELDQEGRYRIQFLGYFSVTPDMFTTEEFKDCTTPFYEFKLTEEGWQKLEKQGLKHPGRGWVSLDPINLKTLDEYRIAIQKEIKQLEEKENNIIQFINKHCDD